MAANQLRAMYTRIGITNEGDTSIIDVQGIDLVRELGYLNNEDVMNLCKSIRHPGGHLPNPAFVIGGVMNATIPYTGIVVFHRAETNMQLLGTTTGSAGLSVLEVLFSSIALASTKKPPSHLDTFCWLLANFLSQLHLNIDEAFHQPINVQTRGVNELLQLFVVLFLGIFELVT